MAKILFAVALLGCCALLVRADQDDWADIEDSEIDDCSPNQSFISKISGPSCTWECTEYDAQLANIKSRLNNGYYCDTRTASDKEEFWENLWEDLTTDYTCKQTFAPDTTRRLCVSSALSIAITNYIGQFCFPGWNVNGTTPYYETPTEKGSTLGCKTTNTYPFPLNRFFNPGSDEPVIRTVDIAWDHPDEDAIQALDKVYREEANSSKLSLQKLSKKINRMQAITAKKNMPTARREALEQQLSKLTERHERLSGKLEKNASNSANLRNLRMDVPFENEEGYEAFMECNGEKSACNKLGRRLQRASKAAAAAKAGAETEVSLTESTTSARSLECVSSNACVDHAWRENIVVNGSCLEVCAFAGCTPDFTFPYCFSVTISMGLSVSDCHANMVTRPICYDE